MNTINPNFTFNYSQPEEYRFSQDSVFLARMVFELFQNDLSEMRGLDLCSGCGVIGLEFLFHSKTAKKKMPTRFDFLEVQEIYKSHFETNLLSYGANLPPVSFLNENYEVLKTEVYKNTYDLILSNPPYFRPGQGILSPSEFKNRCRFFIDSDFKNFIEAIDNALKPNGEAYILLKDLSVHGISPLDEARHVLETRRSINIVADIRGTSLAVIR